ncbi:MAG TPA: hypothetical protein VMT59_16930 [Gaiellaceae bacterium]|nr:hypothetical protein [Gaiellaceae bacterium]
MNAEIAQPYARRRSARARTVRALGPLTVLAGVVWAIVQPWRITLLHPVGQGFWWLLIEPPLIVVAVGVGFWLLVGNPLLEDLDAAES